jgi:tRNA(Arg) A34 adenosine deaminase TadA
MIRQEQEYYMREALFEADRARIIGEVPIGCVICVERPNYWPGPQFA